MTCPGCGSDNPAGKTFCGECGTALEHQCPQMCAWNLWYLGQPDAALARAREAVALARRLDDSFSPAFALIWETVLHWRDLQDAKALLEELGG